METRLTPEAEKAFETIVRWFSPILREKRRQKIGRAIELMAREQGVKEADTRVVVDAARFVLQPVFEPRLKALIGEAPYEPPSPETTKESHHSLEAYYAAPRQAGRWQFAADPPDKPPSRMKVLAFCASPRPNGNSEVLVDEALRGAREAGASTEKIRLIELPIANCRNTFISRDNFVAQKMFPDLKFDYCCYSEGRRDAEHRGVCTLEDKMAETHQKITEADAIVIGFPIYTGWETILLTNFLERWGHYEYCIPPRRSSLDRRGMVVCTWGSEEINVYDHIIENVIRKMDSRHIMVTEVLFACGLSGLLGGLDLAGKPIISRYPDEVKKAYLAGKILVTGKQICSLI